jgi:hypothetical protein
MNLKKLTKEDQDRRLEKVSEVASLKQHRKPSFGEWVIHDPKAFGIIYKVSVYGATVITGILAIMSFVFDMDIVLKILFTAIFGLQLWNTFRLLKVGKSMTVTVNDALLGGKLDGSSQYKTAKHKHQSQAQVG